MRPQLTGSRVRVKHSSPRDSLERTTDVPDDPRFIRPYDQTKEGPPPIRSPPNHDLPHPSHTSGPAQISMPPPQMSAPPIINNHMHIGLHPDSYAR